jgi:pimeloyl-ACP methyl ester carboxylesterase
MPLWAKRTLQGLWVVTFLGVLVGGVAYIAARSIPPPPVPFAGAKVPDDLLVVTSRSWYQLTLFGTDSFAEFQKRPASLKWLANSLSGIELRAQPPEFTRRHILVLVHGYNAPERKVFAYFADVLPLLRTSIGPDATVLLYDWPSRARHWDELSPSERRGFLDPGGHSKSVARPSAPIDWERDAYREDVLAARGHGAEGLASLLRLLAGKGATPIRIVAHSMGGLVVMEALKRLADAVVAIEAVVLLAPDLPSDLLDDGEIRRSLQAVGRLEILHSRHDQALLYSQIANLGRRLGRDGFLGVSAVPSNVRLHDVTTVLGEGIEVHGQYLHAARAKEIGLPELIAGRVP